MRFLASAVLAAACCAVAVLPVPSFAAASGSARLGNFSFSVVDLTPDDGAAAGYRFIDLAAPGGGTSVSASVRIAGAEPVVESLNNPDGFAALAANAQVPGVTMHASASANELRAEGAGNVANGSFSGNVDSRSFRDAAATPAGEIVLAPYSRLVLQVQMELAVAVDGHCLLDRCESAYASAGVSLQGVPGEVGPGMSEFDSLTLDWADPTRRHLSDSRSLTFVLSLDNMSAQEMYATYEASVELSGLSLAPIPEPSTWALMAAGLLAVGTAARHGRGRFTEGEQH